MATKVADVRVHVNDLYQTVYESATVPATLEAARLQLSLTKFFMRENIRDAAYVSLENAKDLLARADDSKQEKSEAQALSKEAEMVENTLHKNLPYTF